MDLEKKAANPAHLRIIFQTNVQGRIDTRMNITPKAVRIHSTADVATLDFAAIPAGTKYTPIVIHDARESFPKANDRVVIGGFGKTSKAARDASLLRWGKAIYNGPKETYEARDSKKRTTTYKMGLEFRRDGTNVNDPANAFTCTGDSGGPVLQWRAPEGWGVIGVTSASSCDEGGVGYAADASALKAWLLL